MMRRIVILTLTVGVLVIAGLGAAYRMAQFARTIASDDAEAFGAVSVFVYLVGMLPLLFLMLWAVLTGQFRELERQKYRLLELDREIERGGGMGFVVETRSEKSR